MGDFWAMVFCNIAKLSIVQNYYIRKYNLWYEIAEDGWLMTYSNDQLIEAGGAETEWKWTATLHGLSVNPLVIKLLNV